MLRLAVAVADAEDGADRSDVVCELLFSPTASCEVEAIVFCGADESTAFAGFLIAGALVSAVKLELWNERAVRV